MEIKKCRACGELKPLYEFNRNKNKKDGYFDRCKACENERNKRYGRSKNGVASTIYRSQKSSSKQRGHPMPTYSSKELKEWLYSQSKFHELYDTWKAGGYISDLKPSCDRLDDYKPYTLDNLQIVTWRRNYKRVHRDMMNGVNNKTNKAVLQFTLDGELIAEYYSLRKAERCTGVGNGSISSVCKGNSKTAGGFIWKFKENN